jgi:hypothetical protein
MWWFARRGKALIYVFQIASQLRGLPLRPGPNLVISVATLAPQLRLLHGLEALASQDWDVEKMKSAIDLRTSGQDSLRIPTRIGHLQDEHLCNAVFADIRALLISSPMYTLIPQHERTIARIRLLWQS